MFNFSGKYVPCIKKAPTEIDFNAFWKNLDETYFTHVDARGLEDKWSEVTGKIHYYTQNHHHGRE